MCSCRFSKLFHNNFLTEHHRLLLFTTWTNNFLPGNISNAVTHLSIKVLNVLSAGVSSTVIRNNIFILKKHDSTLFFTKIKWKKNNSNILDYEMKQPCIEMKQLFNIKVCNKKDLYCAICNSISSQEILIFPKTVIKKYLQNSCAIQEHCHI